MGRYVKQIFRADYIAFEIVECIIGRARVNPPSQWAQYRKLPSHGLQ